MSIQLLHKLGKNNEIEVHTPVAGGQYTHVLGISPASALAVGTSGSFKGIYCRFSSTATTGEPMAMYLGMEANADGGEAYGLFVGLSVKKNKTTCRAAQFCMGFSTTAGASECSGLGVVLAATMFIPNVAAWAAAGTYAIIDATIWSDGVNSTPTSLSELAFFRVVNGGNSTGMAAVEAKSILFDLVGFTETKSGGNMIQGEGDVPSTDNTARYIKCKVNGTLCYLVLFSAYDID